MELSWSDFKLVVNTRSVSPQYLVVGANYWIKLIDGAFEVECLIPTDPEALETADFIANYQSNCNKSVLSQVSIQNQPTLPAFNSKIVTTNGVTKSLYKRHTGIQSQVYVATPTDIFFTIPYAQCKIVGASVIGGESLDSVNLYILDTDTNTYSQAPVGVVGPNYKLNQFGFNVNVSKDYFQNISQYDADLYIGMKIKITYISKSDKIVGINLDIHEVK